MATPTFKYPNTTAPTVTLEFARGGFFNDTRDPIANQATDETESKEIMAVSLGADVYEQTFTVQVPKATQAGNAVDVAKLLSFVSTTIGWSLRTFFFTNSDGTSYEVKLLNADLKPSNVYVNYYEYVLKLREV